MAKVIIYSTPSCIYCKKAKEFLDSKKIAYEEFNVAEDKAALDVMVKKSGQMGVPVFDVDGQVIIGFNQAGLESLLHL